MAPPTKNFDQPTSPHHFVVIDYKIHTKRQSNLPSLSLRCQQHLLDPLESREIYPPKIDNHDETVRRRTTHENGLPVVGTLPRSDQPLPFQSRGLDYQCMAQEDLSNDHDNKRRSVSTTISVS